MVARIYRRGRAKSSRTHPLLRVACDLAACELVACELRVRGVAIPVSEMPTTGLHPDCRGEPVMAYEYIIGERLDGVALITLNRPGQAQRAELSADGGAGPGADRLRAGRRHQGRGPDRGRRARLLGRRRHSRDGRPLVRGIGTAQRDARPHLLAYRELCETADRRDQRSRLWRRGAAVLLARSAHRVRADAVPLSGGELRAGQFDLVAAGTGRHPEGQGTARYRPRRAGRRGRAHRAC